MNDGFKVWDNIRKRWLGGVVCDCNGNLFKDYKVNSNCELSEVPCMQTILKKLNPDVCKKVNCTGLPDKNGKPIYEGDIVKYIDEAGKKQIGTVIWCDAKYYINCVNGDDEGNQDLELHPDYSKDIEIIGNIFENKELLK